MKVQNILETIGDTPHVKINKLFGDEINVWMKIEKLNPGGSVKDRVAQGMIEDAEARGLLQRGGTIVEPTSGNTGIGLAVVAAVKGYNLILVMPESMSLERRCCLEALGAKIVLTPAEEGMSGSIKKADEIAAEESAWMPQQFNNPVNSKVHYETTAQEILADFSCGVDFFFSAVGTGGQISGIGKALKERNKRTKVIAIEPDTSAVLSGGQAGSHAIQGIGAGFIPKVLDTTIIDEVVCISKEEAYEYTHRSAKEEGILVGISSGATLAAIAKKRSSIPDGSTVILIAYDTGDRYLSVDGLF